MNNPFPGIRSYRSNESSYFFGRENEIRELVDKLDHFRFISVVGASGCGKSSLVYAGLIPALKQGINPSDEEQWLFASFSPGESPILNLSEALSNLAENQQIQFEDPYRDLKTREKTICDVTRPITEGGKKKILILVDQFEELFTLQTPGNEASTFTDLLVNSAWEEGCRVYIVMTIRSDENFAACSQFPKLSAAINNCTYLVPQMSRDQKELALLQPAGGRISGALLNRVLNDSEAKIALQGKRASHDELPIIQHTMMRAWDHLETTNTDDNTYLEVKNYEKVGGITEALNTHLDALLARLNADEKSVALDLFLDLAELDEQGRFNRIPRSFKQLLNEQRKRREISREKLSRVLDHFRGNTCCFILPNSDQPIEDETMVSICHESLIRQWIRLRELVEEQDELRLLSTNASFWNDKDRKPDHLNLSSDRIEKFTGLISRHPSSVNHVDKAFLAENVKKIRKAKTRKVAAWGLSAFILITCILGIASVKLADVEQRAKLAEAEQRRISAEQKAKLVDAERRRIAAEQKAQLAEEAQKRIAAEQKARLAEEQRKLAEAQQKARLAEEKERTDAILNENQRKALEELDRQKAKAEKAKTLVAEYTKTLTQRNNGIFTILQESTCTLDYDALNRESRDPFFKNFLQTYPLRSWKVLAVDEPILHIDSEGTVLGGRIDALIVCWLTSHDDETQVIFLEESSGWNFDSETGHPNLRAFYSNSVPVDEVQGALKDIGFKLQTQLGKANDLGIGYLSLEQMKRSLLMIQTWLEITMGRFGNERDIMTGPHNPKFINSRFRQQPSNYCVPVAMPIITEKGDFWEISTNVSFNREEIKLKGTAKYIFNIEFHNAEKQTITDRSLTPIISETKSKMSFANLAWRGVEATKITKSENTGETSFETNPVSYLEVESARRDLTDDEREDLLKRFLEFYYECDNPNPKVGHEWFFSQNEIEKYHTVNPPSLENIIEDESSFHKSYPKRRFSNIDVIAMEKTDDSSWEAEIQFNLTLSPGGGTKTIIDRAKLDHPIGTKPTITYLDRVSSSHSYNSRSSNQRPFRKLFQR